MATQTTSIPIFDDNYIWVIYNTESKEAIAVDPGLAQPLIDFLESKQLTLVSLLITHHHPDHTGGIAQLQDYCAQHSQKIAVYGPQNPKIKGITHPLADQQKLSLPSFNLDFTIVYTPGHTLDHICYYTPTPQPWLFCGDTLFSAGCGRLFEGSPAQMYQSLSTLASLPAQTLVFCTHEYTAANLRFASMVEPENPDIQHHITKVTALREQQQSTLPSTLALEKKINPFLRADERCVQAAILQKTGQQTALGADTFAALRAWKDNS